MNSCVFRAKVGSHLREKTAEIALHPISSQDPSSLIFIYIPHSSSFSGLGEPKSINALAAASVPFCITMGLARGDFAAGDL